MQATKIKVGIIGGAGYTGGELIRILLNHPKAEISYVVSKSQAGKLVCNTHTDLIGDTLLVFESEANEGADVVFLCMQHGESKKFLAANNFLLKKKVIDLSRDFRIKNQESRIKNQDARVKNQDARVKNQDARVKNQEARPGDQYFIYGLPEFNKEKIQRANYIANPGCFATAIQLALLPLAKNKILKGDVHVNATTGSTGAGQSLASTTHFSWRNSNLSVYKAFEHEHLAEIKQSLLQLQNDFSGEINFIPQRGAFTRGILASIMLDCDLPQEEINSLYKNYYEEKPFVHIVENADVKQVVNTNKCFLQLIKHNKQLAIVSVIDNLLKGASGQAIQNMNLMFRLDETTGLKLKAAVY